MKLFEFISTIIGTVGITLLITSACLGDIFEMTAISGICMLLGGGVALSCIQRRIHRRDVHFRDKMESLRLKKY